MKEIVDNLCGLRLKIFREKRHLSYEQLASITGISEHQLEHYEYGTKTISLPHLFAISCGLNIFPVDLIPALGPSGLGEQTLNPLGHQQFQADVPSSAPHVAVSCDDTEKATYGRPSRKACDPGLTYAQDGGSAIGNHPQRLRQHRLPGATGVMGKRWAVAKMHGDLRPPYRHLDHERQRWPQIRDLELLFHKRKF